jgi:hypothetical protein
MGEKMKKIGFLFGAGAEVGYGLPSGGKFALEIFKQDSSISKRKFKENRESIDGSTAYAGDWLPKDYKTKSVGSYGKSVFESIIKDTLEHNRNNIIKKLNNFDEIAKYEEKEIYKIYQDRTITDIIEDRIKRQIKNCNMQQQVSYIDSFNEGNTIFSNQYFSALLILYKNKDESNIDVRSELRKILVSILQLQVGALSENLSRKINDGFFSNKDDELDFLDDMGDIIQLNYQSIGLYGLEYLIENKDISIYDDNSALIVFMNNIIENIYSSVLDYKTLIDSNWRYLYCPSEEWSKFCKINIFLLTVRDYIESQLKEFKLDNKGYYHDVAEYMKKGKIEVTTIATTNYNTFIEDIIDCKITYLNGSTELWYDPYLNRIGTNDKLNENERHFLVPLLFTQSGTKPMTSITMSKCYVDMYEKYKLSDLICIIGFGFNLDDEHINGIIRTLVDVDDKHIIVVDVNNENDVDKIAKKLKTTKVKNIHHIVVDKINRKSNDIIWIEKINSDYLNLY